MTLVIGAPVTGSADRNDPVDMLSTDNFQTIARIAKSMSGLDIGDAKTSLVVARLLRRLRALGLSGFDAYCARLTAADGAEERAHMVSALTTNVTAFFREPHHFDYLVDYLRKTGAIESGIAPLRIWCAAASTGEEAYSAALTLLGVHPLAGNYNARILATDINPNVIASARAGLYDLDEKKRIPVEFFRKFCCRSVGPGQFSFQDPVRALIRFRELNLLAAWPMRQKFDVIFCRNVAIYFDAPTKSALWKRLAGQLVPGGELYVGHSERIDDPGSYGLRAFGTTAYRMRPS